MNGILLLDKSLEMTSNAALQKAKRLFGIKKAGHTGSLDPLATGMLPICFGEATKFSQYLLESDKRYLVTGQLGIKTSTGDAEGEIIEKKSVPVLTPAVLENIIQQFVGEIQQIPPMFSAIKQNGKPLYELARKGVTVERKPRSVRIFQLRLLAFESDHFIVEVHCSKGTYIRTLIEDIGDKIGCCAYVSSLRRLSVSPYQQEKMYSLEQLTDLLQQGASIKHLLLPVETALQSLPVIKLITDCAYYFRTGQAVKVSNLPMAGLVSVFDNDDKFMGIGEVLEDGRLAPKRLISQN